MATRKTKGKKAAGRRAKRVVHIRYSRTRGGRVRYTPLDAGRKTASPSYASRQGARRAARKQFKGSKVVAMVGA